MAMKKKSKKHLNRINARKGKARNRTLNMLERTKHFFLNKKYKEIFKKIEKMVCGVNAKRNRIFVNHKINRLH